MIFNKYLVDHTICTNFNEPPHLAFPTSNTSQYTWHLVVANVTSDLLFQYPAVPLRILQFSSICNNDVLLFVGGLPLAVLNILQGIYFKFSKSSEHLSFCSTRGINPHWAHLGTPALPLTDVPPHWHFLSGCMFAGLDQRCVFIHVFLN